MQFIQCVFLAAKVKINVKLQQGNYVNVMIDEYCRRQQLLNKLKPVNEGVMKTFNIELSLASSGKH